MLQLDGFRIRMYEKVKLLNEAKPSPQLIEDE
jgi:hypothetical protein